MDRERYATPYWERETINLDQLPEWKGRPSRLRQIRQRLQNQFGPPFDRFLHPKTDTDHVRRGLIEGAISVSMAGAVFFGFMAALPEVTRAEKLALILPAAAGLGMFVDAITQIEFAFGMWEGKFSPENVTLGQGTKEPLEILPGSAQKIQHF